MAKQPKSSRFPSARIWRILVLIGILLLSTFFLIQQSIRQNFQTVKVAPYTEKQTQTTTGYIIPATQQLIYADESKGSIKEVFVKEGKNVKQGDPLFSYDDTHIVAQIQEAQTNQQIAQQKIAQIHQSISAIETNIEQAKQTPVDATIQAEWYRERQNLQLTEQEWIADAVKASQLYEQYKQKQEQYIVKSTMNGIVHHVHIQPGQKWVPNKQKRVAPALLQITSIEPVQIEGILDEQQLPFVKTGQAIEVTTNIIPRQSWSGTVTEIRTLPIETIETPYKYVKQDTRQKEFHYPFRAVVQQPDRLFPGNTAKINIITQVKTYIRVPTTSLVKEGHSAYVYVPHTDKIEKRKVTQGENKGQWTEITDGLTKGESILKAPPWYIDWIKK